MAFVEMDFASGGGKDMSFDKLFDISNYAKDVNYPIASGKKISDYKALLVVANFATGGPISSSIVPVEHMNFGSNVIYVTAMATTAYYGTTGCMFINDTTMKIAEFNGAGWGQYNNRVTVYGVK